MVPLVVGFVGFMLIPCIDENPSTRSSDRKFSIMVCSIVLAGSSSLASCGVFLRGKASTGLPIRGPDLFRCLEDWLDLESHS